MNGKKILVTGGAGYIGSHAAAELHANGYHAVIVDNLSRSDRSLLSGLHKVTGKQPDFHQGDCNDKKFLTDVFKSQGPFAAVIHFAAFKSVGESVQIPLAYYDNNVGSMIALLQVMEENETRNLIFSSSCTVYGQPESIPVGEDAPFKRAESPYGATKQVCERILQDVSNRKFRMVSLRYFNPIGAHPSALMGELPVGVPNNLVPYITQTAAGLRKNLTIFGGDYNTPDGTCLRDYIHVMDLADAHVAAIKYLEGKSEENLLDVFNLGTGKGVSVLQLVKEFIKVTGVQLPYTIGPRRPGDVEKVYADPSRANRMLAWSTKYSIQDSLLHAWQWEKSIRGLK